MDDRTWVHGLHSAEGSKKWTRVHVLSDAEAAAAVAAGVKTTSCRPDHSLEPIRAAVPDAVISTGFRMGLSVRRRKPSVKVLRNWRAGRAQSVALAPPNSLRRRPARGFR